MARSGETTERRVLVATYGVCPTCGAPRDAVLDAPAPDADSVSWLLRLVCTVDPVHGEPDPYGAAADEAHAEWFEQRDEGGA